MHYFDKYIHGIGFAVREAINESLNGELYDFENDDASLIPLLKNNAILKYAEQIWAILQVSYKAIGGIKTYNSYEDFCRKLRFGKIVFENDEIIACSIYRRVDGDSYKMVAIGCNQLPNGKTALKQIIQSDIVDLDMHFWAEVSGAIEHYFQKFNGYPMPNMLAPEILKMEQDIFRFDSDNAHYERPIGENREYYRKIIYGIKNKEMFDKAVQSVEDYGTFMKKINQMKESTNNTYNVKQAIYIIDNIYRAHEEDGFNELIPSWHNALLNSLETLNNVLDKTEEIEDYINDAQYLLDSMPLLKIHKI